MGLVHRYVIPIKKGLKPDQPLSCAIGLDDFESAALVDLCLDNPCADGLAAEVALLLQVIADQPHRLL